MTTENWMINEDKDILTPEKLKADPDKYGGLGMHMIAAIQDGVVTIPLQNGSCVNIQTADSAAVKRIIADGGVTIISEGYWCDIRTTNVYFLNTEDSIPIWKGGLV